MAPAMWYKADVFLHGVVNHRHAGWIPLGLLTALLTSGCASRGSLDHATLGGEKQTTRSPKATPDPDRARPWRYWRDELGQFNTIGQLWGAINRHHDALGHALHPRYPTTKILHPRRRVRQRPGMGAPPPDHPAPPQIDRPPVVVRARAPLCRRACNHVRAICYAARRICQIARRLQDYGALLTCKRATTRCADARRVARRRCQSCG